MVLPILRIIVLSLTAAFSLIVLGLAADLTSLTEEFFAAYFYFAALAIAIACITLLTVPVMIIVDLVRTGAFTSMVVVELSWLGVLWVLWLATGAYTASIGYFGTCDYINTDVNLACHEFNAIEAFAFLNFIFLFVYFVVLLVFAIIGANRGHRVWTNTVKETPFLAPAAVTSSEKPQVQQPQYTGSTQSPTQTHSPAPGGYGGQPVYQNQSPYPQV